MNEVYQFQEDARKRRPLMLLITILCYLGFVAYIIYDVTSSVIADEKHIVIIDGDNPFVGLAIGALLVGVFLTIALKSKYLKYYMFITENEMEFHANNEQHKYKLSDFKKYEIVSERRRYTDYRLSFTDGKVFYVSSFKSTEFKSTLDEVTSNRQKEVRQK